MSSLMQYEQPRYTSGPTAARARWFTMVCLAMPDHILDAPALLGSNVTNRELIEAYSAGSQCSEVWQQKYMYDSYDPFGVSTFDGAAAIFSYDNNGYENCLMPHRVFYRFAHNIEFIALLYDIEHSSLMSWSRTVDQWPSLRIQVRKATIDRLPWEVREIMRIYFGEYKPLPWNNKHPDVRPIPGHIAHISQNDPLMVAFTQDASKGARNIQTTMRPGRYLKKFYPDLTDQRIFEISAEMTGSYELRFAKTEREVIDVYLRGPSSCMTHSSDEYAGHIHPVAVYGDSDLHVAYMTLPGTSSIKARALVWPEKKKIGRLYGPSDQAERLRKLLAREGYSELSDAHNLCGAKIRRIVDKNGDGDRLIMPYIDGPSSYDVIDKDWCKIGGYNSACYTNGTDREETDDGVYCDCCEEHYREDDMRTVYTSRRSTRTWCEGCCDSHATYIDSFCEYVDNDEAVEVITEYRQSGSHYREYFACWQECWFHCDGLDEYVHDDIEAVYMQNGDTWCKPYFDEHGVTVDGEHYRRGEEPAEEPAEEAA